MAHFEKFKKSTITPMTRHYSRDREGTLRRGNIDETKTHLNYDLSNPYEGIRWNHHRLIKDRLEKLEESTGKKVRSDAVVMADWVVTAPENLKPEDLKKFFESAFDFLCQRYGRENTISAFVHMDEKTPHMHYAWMPFTPDGRLCVGDVVPRGELKRFHRDLSVAVERDLGYRVAIYLDNDDPLKGLNVQKKEDIAAAKAEIMAISERLECLRRSEEAERAAIAGLDSRISDGERHLGELRERAGSLRERLVRTGERIGLVRAGLRSFMVATGSQVSQRLKNVLERLVGAPEITLEDTRNLFDHVRQEKEEKRAERQRQQQQRNRGRGFER